MSEHTTRTANSNLPRTTIGLFVPTYNAGRHFDRWLEALAGQTVRPDRLYAIDSSSRDKTAELAAQAGFTMDVIPQAKFNHGGTRNQGAHELAQCDVVVFLTQDAILASPDALKNLVACFNDPGVSAAYGRQLPHIDAGLIGTHARIFNYPAASQIKTKADIPALGLKTAFCSNSFAAYRTSALKSVGGFPADVIFGEDMCVAARLILAGSQVAYCAFATVYHSHDYTLMEEFRRYFDIGVLHARENWLLTHFGKAEGEGLRFVRSEFKYLLNRAPWLIPSALLRTTLKLMAYRIGRQEHRLSARWKSWLSMNRSYWSKKPSTPPIASKEIRQDHQK